MPSARDMGAPAHEDRLEGLTGKVVPISSGEIHLWLVADAEIRDHSLLRQYSEWLTEAERIKWQRFHFAKDRHQYLVTRALVRWALSSYIVSIREAEWRFVTNEYGRPAIANTLGNSPRLKFNISHTSGLIVMTLCLEGEVGVDVEHLERSGQAVEIAEHFFSPREVWQLRALPSMLQRNRFFDLWTLKESYIKARGMGLSIPLDSFSFCFPADTSIDIQMEPSAADHAGGWRFWQLSPTAAYKIAVAHRNDRPQEPVELRVSRVLPGRSIAPAACDVFRSSDCAFDRGSGAARSNSSAA